MRHNISVLINNPNLLPSHTKCRSASHWKRWKSVSTRLYGCSAGNSNKNALRHQNFIRTVYNSKYNIANLSPTKAVAEQHLYRTYLQVQLWQGNVLKAEEWDWKRRHAGLSPVTTTMPPAPPQLLKLISCICKKVCRAACGCLKSGLRCLVMCLQCNNICENVPDEDLETWRMTKRTLIK